VIALRCRLCGFAAPLLVALCIYDLGTLFGEIPGDPADDSEVIDGAAFARGAR
jgi:hypothetical protein